MDRLTKEQRHRNMSNIKSKDTGIELKLRKALWKKDIDIGRIIINFQENQTLFLPSIEL